MLTCKIDSCTVYQAMCFVGSPVIAAYATTRMITSRIDREPGPIHHLCGCSFLTRFRVHAIPCRHWRNKQVLLFWSSAQPTPGIGNVSIPPDACCNLLKTKRSSLGSVQLWSEANSSLTGTYLLQQPHSKDFVRVAHASSVAERHPNFIIKWPGFSKRGLG